MAYINLERRMNFRLWDDEIEEIVNTEMSVREYLSLGADEIPEDAVAPVKCADDISCEIGGREFSCSACGAWVGVVECGPMDGGRFNYCPGCGAKIN